MAFSLGKENTYGLTFKFRNQRDEDLKDAKTLTERLGIKHTIYNLEPIIKAHQKISTDARLKNYSSDQYLALIGGISSVVALRFADEKDCVVVSSTNKTEILTSFYNIESNMGNIFPLAEFYKTEVRYLANSIIYDIPNAILNKAPRDGIKTRPNDEDILGLPYESIDKVCYFLEQGMNLEEIIKKTNPNIHQISEIMQRIKESERKLEFPSCKVYLPERGNIFNCQESKSNSYQTTRKYPAPTSVNSVAKFSDAMANAGERRYADRKSFMETRSTANNMCRAGSNRRGGG